MKTIAALGWAKFRSNAFDLQVQRTSWVRVVRRLLPDASRVKMPASAQTVKIGAELPATWNEADLANSGLMHAALIALERVSRLNVKALHNDPLKQCALADLVREIGLLARMRIASRNIVLTALKERVKFEPLPPGVKGIDLEFENSDEMLFSVPLAHFTVVDLLCQLTARWPVSERPVIGIRLQGGQVRYSCKLKPLDNDGLQRLELALHTLDQVLTPLKRQMRSEPADGIHGHHQLSILIGA